MKRLLTLVLAIVALTAAPVYAAADKQEPTTRQAAATTDGDLEKAVRERLDADVEVKAAGLAVRADAARNQVTITGSVPSQELRLRAIRLARSARKNLIVVDGIDVEPRVPRPAAARS
jgi:hypothetical protein